MFYGFVLRLFDKSVVEIYYMRALEHKIMMNFLPFWDRVDFISPSSSQSFNIIHLFKLISSPAFYMMNHMFHSRIHTKDPQAKMLY